jgi:hypothetical protein
MPKRSSSVFGARKKKGKKGPPPPGVFISSLLGGSKSSDGSVEAKAQGRVSDETEKGNSEKAETYESAVESETVHYQYSQVVQYRTVLEFALLTLAYGDSLVKVAKSVDNTKIEEMANNSKEGSSHGMGLSRFMNPVQDLGRSLMGFLLGHNQQVGQSQSSTSSSTTLDTKRDSIISTSSKTDIISTPGRSRPVGHPAKPSTNTTTPIAIRRTKAEKISSRSLDPQQQQQPVAPPRVSADVTATKSPVARRKPPPGPARQNDSSSSQCVLPTPGSKCVSLPSSSPVPVAEQPSANQRRRRKNRKGNYEKLSQDNLVGSSLSSSAQSVQSQQQSPPAVDSHKESQSAVESQQHSHSVVDSTDRPSDGQQQITPIDRETFSCDSIVSSCKGDVKISKSAKARNNKTDATNTSIKASKSQSKKSKGPTASKEDKLSTNEKEVAELSLRKSQEGLDEEGAKLSFTTSFQQQIVPGIVQANTVTEIIQDSTLQFNEQNNTCQETSTEQKQSETEVSPLRHKQNKPSLNQVNSTDIAETGFGGNDELTDGFVTARNSLFVSDISASSLTWPPPFPALDIYSDARNDIHSPQSNESDIPNSNQTSDSLITFQCAEVKQSNLDISLTHKENSKVDTSIQSMVSEAQTELENRTIQIDTVSSSHDLAYGCLGENRAISSVPDIKVAPEVSDLTTQTDPSVVSSLTDAQYCYTQTNQITLRDANQSSLIGGTSPSGRNIVTAPCPLVSETSDVCLIPRDGICAESPSIANNSAAEPLVAETALGKLELLSPSSPPSFGDYHNIDDSTPTPYTEQDETTTATSATTELLPLLLTPSVTSTGPAPPPVVAPTGPPLPPPLPPPGFLTDGIPKPPKTKQDILKEKGAKDGPGTLKKQKCTRERALLEQLSSLDDTFANFLKANLSIKTIQRERTDSDCDANLRPKCRRRTNTNGSDGGKERRRGSALNKGKETDTETAAAPSEGCELTQLPTIPSQVDICNKETTGLPTQSDNDTVVITGATVHLDQNNTTCDNSNRVIQIEDVATDREEKQYSTIRHTTEVKSTKASGDIKCTPVVSVTEKAVDSTGSHSDTVLVGVNDNQVDTSDEIENVVIVSSVIEKTLDDVPVSEDAAVVDATDSTVHDAGGIEDIAIVNVTENTVGTTGSTEDNAVVNVTENVDEECLHTVSDRDRQEEERVDKVNICETSAGSNMITEVVLPSSTRVDTVSVLSTEGEGTLIFGNTTGGVHDAARGRGGESVERVEINVPKRGQCCEKMPQQAQSCDINLSKSDSGYSGHISAGEEDGDVGQNVKAELTMDQALQRYDKTLGIEVPVKPKRQRVLSDRSEYSEYTYSGHSDSDDEEDGVAVRERRTRDTRSYNSRRSSTDSSEDGFNQNVRDLKAELKELEEKFRKAMVANASLDNEKCQLMFQVDLLKDRVEEGEEQSALVAKELREKTREHELLRRDHEEKVRAVQLLETAIVEQQAMLQERGLVLVGQEAEEEELGEEEQETRTRAIVSQETSIILAGLGTGPLDVRIKRLAAQRDDLQDTVRRLKLDLEEEHSKSSLIKGQAMQEEIERETKKALDDYKFKMQKSEQEIATLQANVARLESQVSRYKCAADTAEQAEENLKSDRRKMQRELRDAVTKNEELETANRHLEKRLDKLKTAKSNLLKEL